MEDTFIHLPKVYEISQTKYTSRLTRIGQKASINFPNEGTFSFGEICSCHVLSNVLFMDNSDLFCLVRNNSL